MVANDGVHAQNWIQLSQRVNFCNTVLCACLSKIWCHTMHLVPIVKLESPYLRNFRGLTVKIAKRDERNWKYEHLSDVLCWIFSKFAKRSNPLLYLKEGLRHLAIKCKSIIQIKIPWGCSSTISKVSSIDVRSRWKIRLRDTFPE